MKNQVYEKFEKELQANPDNRALIVINDALLKLCNNNDICKKLLKNGKSLSGALKAMEKEAKKQACNGCACISYEEGMDIVYKYFEINTSNSQTFEKKQRVEKKNIFDLL